MAVMGATQGAGFEQTGSDAKVRKLKMYGNPPDNQPIVETDAQGQVYVNPAAAGQPTSFAKWAKKDQGAGEGTAAAAPVAQTTDTGDQTATQPRAVAANPVAGAVAASRTMTAEGLGADAAKGAVGTWTSQAGAAAASKGSGKDVWDKVTPTGVRVPSAPVQTAGVSTPQAAAGTAAESGTPKATAETAEVSLPKATPKRMSYQEMVDRYFADNEDTPEARKRRKRETVINGISDMISALSNLYDTTRGAKSSWDPTKGLSARAQQRWKEMESKANADKEARLRLYMQAAKGDDDYNRWLAQWKDHQNQQKLENKYRDKQDQRADKQLALTEDREKRDAELQPSRVRTANANATEAETKAKYTPKLLQAQLDNTKASTAAERKRTALMGLSGGSGGGGSHGSGSYGGSSAGYGDKAGRYALGNYTVNGKVWDDDSDMRQLYSHVRRLVLTTKGTAGAKNLIRGIDAKRKNAYPKHSSKEDTDIIRSGLIELMTNNYDPKMQALVGNAIEAYDASRTGYQRPKGANTSQKKNVDTRDIFK